MTCVDIQELLSAYYDEELSPRDEDIVNAHLVSCDQCLNSLLRIQDVVLLFAPLQKNQSVSYRQELRHADSDARRAAEVLLEKLGKETEAQAEFFAAYMEKAAVRAEKKWRKRYEVPREQRTATNDPQEGSNRKPSADLSATCRGKSLEENTFQSEDATRGAELEKQTPKGTVQGPCEGAGIGQGEAPPEVVGSRPDRIVLYRKHSGLHCAWEITRKAVEKAEAALGKQWQGSKPVLRVHVTNVNNCESHSHDVDVRGGVPFYVDMPNPPSSIQVEVHLGYLSTDGSFFALARSNIVTVEAKSCKVRRLLMTWQAAA